jgi:hypothetical protein
MDAIGFFGFEIDGDVKLANVESSYEAFAPHYLDWIREANREDLLRMVTTLQTVPNNADDDEIAQAFGYASAEDFSEKVGAFPEGVLDEALGSPKDMLYNGVVYGTTKPSDFRHAEYGYVVNLTQGTLDCYIGNQLAPHDEGLFFMVAPVTDSGTIAEHHHVDSVEVFAPRLYASYDWDNLPSKAEFLANHYRALMLQEDMNNSAITKSKKTKKKRHSLLAFGRNRPVLEDSVCGAIVKSNGKPCVLRAGHGGNHRSRI